MKFKLSFLIASFLINSFIVYGQYIGKVVGISDGDTFTILVNDSSIKVRLHGIDSPEKKQAFGNESKQVLSDLIFNKEVLIQSKGHDRYGRLIGIAFIDSICINEFMLRNGYAWHYLKYDSNPNWSKLESEAKNLKLGIWNDSLQVRPWDWRKQKKEKK
jgi:endonuclease YncB( thermonuclease family)